MAQHAKLGMVRGSNGPMAEGGGNAENAAAIARAEFKHNREESWLLKGKGWRYSVIVDPEDVEFGGETEEEVKVGICKGKEEELQPQDCGDGELVRAVVSRGSEVVEEEGGRKGSDFLRSQCFSLKTGMSKKAL